MLNRTGPLLSVHNGATTTRFQVRSHAVPLVLSNAGLFRLHEVQTLARDTFDGDFPSVSTSKHFPDLYVLRCHPDLTAGGLGDSPERAAGINKFKIVENQGKGNNKHGELLLEMYKS